MWVHARDLAVGDILELNDWLLHVTWVDRDAAVAVLTAELGFLIHFDREDVVTVQARAAAA